MSESTTTATPIDGDSTQAPNPTAAAPTVEGETPAGPSKSELKRRAKEAEKAKKAAERAAKEEEDKKKREAAASMDNAVQNYGKLPLHQSQERLGEWCLCYASLVRNEGEISLEEADVFRVGRKYLKLSALSKEDVGKEVIFRARLHNMRAQGHLHAPYQRAPLTCSGRREDRLPLLPSADTHYTGCTSGIRRERRTSSFKADAEIRSTHSGTSAYICLSARSS